MSDDIPTAKRARRARRTRAVTEPTCVRWTEEEFDALDRLAQQHRKRGIPELVRDHVRATLLRPEIADIKSRLVH